MEALAFADPPLHARLFALASTRLKSRLRNRLVSLTVACAAAVQLLPLLLLVPDFGITGGGAYVVSMVGACGFLAWMAYGELVRLRASDGQS